MKMMLQLVTLDKESSLVELLTCSCEDMIVIETPNAALGCFPVSVPCDYSTDLFCTELHIDQTHMSF